jgi:hypothetical protein
MMRTSILTALCTILIGFGVPALSIYFSVYSGSLTLPFEAVLARWPILITTVLVFGTTTAAKSRWREP